MFLGHLYVQLNILQNDERQASSCHIVTSSAHSTVLQHLLWVRCARHLAKCKPVCHTKEKYQSCPNVITNFCGRFVTNFPLAYHWVRLKPFGHPVVEFFDKGVGFSWRAYRDLGSRFTYADSAMSPFIATAGTTTPLTAFDKRGITYLVATNVGWLPYLADEGVRYVHYSAHRVRRQFGFNQNIPNDFTAILELITSVRPFLHPSAFEFWSSHYFEFPEKGSLHYSDARVLASRDDFLWPGVVGWP